MTDDPIPQTISRRKFLGVAGGTLAATMVPCMPVVAAPFVHSGSGQRGITWHDVRAWGVEGKGWRRTARYFDRFPAHAEGVVRDAVWNLSRHSAGMSVRFRTDSEDIRVRYTLLSDRLGMPHMPPTGVSGLDLYARDESGVDRWVSVVKPNAREMEVVLAQGLLPGYRTYTIYLPLYNGVESLDIGLSSESRFVPSSPRAEKPIVFHGTSIMHGACASRPGMAFPSILGRRLGRSIINLGFSGNGRMEREVGTLLTELDPALWVIDCLPNMNGEAVAERAEPFIRQLRTAHPDIHIVLVEDRTYANAPFLPRLRERNEGSREAFRAVYARLLDSGMTDLSYVEGDQLLGDDAEATTDGSHPNDLGMMRYADVLEPVLRSALAES